MECSFMIITEIYVMSLDKSYDFKLNEDVIVTVLIEEISNMICQYEQCEIRGDRENLLLFSEEQHKMLSMELSLYENGIQTGDTLILV